MGFRYFFFGLCAQAALHAFPQEACTCWVEPDSSWVFLGHPYRPGSLWSNNEYGQSSYGPLVLPFPFTFGGQTLDSVFINAAGIVSFGHTWGGEPPVNLPLPGAPMLAPFWAPMEVSLSYNAPPDNGIVAYKLTDSALRVSWARMGRMTHLTDSLNSFQLTITNGNSAEVRDGNNVAFCYKEMQWAVGRAYGHPVTPSLAGANTGDDLYYMQLGRFATVDSTWNGRIAQSGVGWLNGRSLAFNTVPQSIPPFFSTTECDTVEVEAGSTGYYRIIAHRGGPAPPVVVSAACPTLSSFAIADQQVDGAHLLTASFTPTADEAGLHTLYFQAATNLGPLSTTQRFVKVQLPLGVAAPSGQVPITIFPNPASGLVQISWNGPWAGAELQVANAEGRILVATPVAGRTFQWDAGGLPEGVYVVRLVSREGTAVARLTITR